MHEKLPWLDYLVRHIGVKEIAGSRHHPLIVDWGQDAGISWWNNDEDAWCAVAVNGALVNSGYPSTRSALARSFTRYGTRLDAPVRGAIVVFPRGKNPLYGHVGIVEQVHSDGTITVVNGNVSNMVRRSTFRTASILPDGIRWPPGAEAPEAGRPRTVDMPLGVRTLHFGSRGPDVAALQRDLNTLNYGLRVDGVFGGRTRDAVARFKARRNMPSDGIADAAMLAALTKAVEVREARQVRRDSATKAAGPIAGAGAVIGAGTAATTAIEVAQEVGGFNDVMVVGGIVATLVAIALGGFLLWRYAVRRAEGPLDTAEEAL